jgi:hypothetical protein
VLSEIRLRPFRLKQGAVLARQLEQARLSVEVAATQWEAARGAGARGPGRRIRSVLLLRPGWACRARPRAARRVL